MVNTVEEVSIEAKLKRFAFVFLSFERIQAIWRYTRKIRKLWTFRILQTMNRFYLVFPETVKKKKERATSVFLLFGTSFIQFYFLLFNFTNCQNKHTFAICQFLLVNFKTVNAMNISGQRRLLINSIFQVFSIFNFNTNYYSIEYLVKRKKNWTLSIFQYNLNKFLLIQFQSSSSSYRTFA